MKALSVFIDSDVVISSLISSSGAAYLLLEKKQKNLKFFISNISQKELKIVAWRLKIKPDKLEKLVKNRFKIIKLKKPNKDLKEKYADYVLDPNDAHIIAGAVESKAKFLLTYNWRHFKREKIKNDFNLIIFTPAIFLQYLRSKSNFRGGV
ncbi:MAG: PIN domain-containing protein [Microgenomates group bacterium]